MLLTIIKDPDGMETGIKITNVSSVLNKDGDRIEISGRMSGIPVVGPGFEPDIECELLNHEAQICHSATSVHQGVYYVTKQVTFTLKIEDISQSIGWDNLGEINLYVIFRRIRQDLKRT